MQAYQIVGSFVPLLCVGLLAPLFAIYLSCALSGDFRFSWLKRSELVLFRFLGIANLPEMNFRTYFFHLLFFQLIGWLVLFCILSFQSFLPLNPQNLPNVSVFLAIEIASSFVTNTNWQSYAGENTLSQFSQMFGIGVQQFIAPATGLAVMLVLIRGITAVQKKCLGNFYIDLTRSIIYVLLPVSFLFSHFFMLEGVPQNLKPNQHVQTLEDQPQEIVQGPVASHEAIKMLGANGGGYTKQNSANPIENPTPFSNFIAIIALLLLPVSLCLVYGRLVKRKAEGYMLLGSFTVFFLLVYAASLYLESIPNPLLGNIASFEGQEWRFGLENTVLWSVATTLTSSGSVNAALSSLAPLSGGLSLLGVLTGEVIFGGVGSGIYNMFFYILFTVFLAGLMIGRTPIYLGKKIESFEIRCAVFAIILPNLLILLGTSFAIVSGIADQVAFSSGPHKITELLYAVASASLNNGSSFGGILADQPQMQIMLSMCMVFGRVGGFFSALFLAFSLAKKSKSTAENFLDTSTPLFGFLLLCTILMIGALTYFPVFHLGPILEHLMVFQAAQ